MRYHSLTRSRDEVRLEVKVLHKNARAHVKIYQSIHVCTYHIHTDPHAKNSMYAHISMYMYMCMFVCSFRGEKKRERREPRAFTYIDIYTYNIMYICHIYEPEALKQGCFLDL